MGASYYRFSVFLGHISKDRLFPLCALPVSCYTNEFNLKKLLQNLLITNVHPPFQILIEINWCMLSNVRVWILSSAFQLNLEYQQRSLGYHLNRGERNTNAHVYKKMFINLRIPVNVYVVNMSFKISLAFFFVFLHGIKRVLFFSTQKIVDRTEESDYPTSITNHKSPLTIPLLHRHRVAVKKAMKFQMIQNIMHVKVRK